MMKIILKKIMMINKIFQITIIIKTYLQSIIYLIFFLIILNFQKIGMKNIKTTILNKFHQIILLVEKIIFNKIRNKIEMLQ